MDWWILWSSRRDEISSVWRENLNFPHPNNYFWGRFHQDPGKFTYCWWKSSWISKPSLKKQISNDVGLHFPSGKHPENPEFLQICTDLIEPSGRKSWDGEIRFLSLGISALGWLLIRKTCQDWDLKALLCLIFMWGHPGLIPGEKEVGKELFSKTLFPTIHHCLTCPTSIVTI